MDREITTAASFRFEDTRPFGSVLFKTLIRLSIYSTEYRTDKNRGSIQIENLIDRFRRKYEGARVAKECCNYFDDKLEMLSLFSPSLPVGKIQYPAREKFSTFVVLFARVLEPEVTSLAVLYEFQVRNT